MGARSSLAPGCSQHIQLFKATSSCRRRASKGLSGQQEADHDDLDDEEQFLNLDDVLEGNAFPLLSCSVVSMCAFAALFCCFLQQRRFGMGHFALLAIHRRTISVLVSMIPWNQTMLSLVLLAPLLAVLPKDI